VVAIRRVFMISPDMILRGEDLCLEIEYRKRIKMSRNRKPNRSKIKKRAARVRAALFFNINGILPENYVQVKNCSIRLAGGDDLPADDVSAPGSYQQ
jgi:hypothetical protein